MFEELIAQLYEYGLEDAEKMVSNIQRRPRKFEILIKKWVKVVENVSRFDQFSMYTVDEYANDIDSRVLLAEMQMFLTKEGKAISETILAPIDDVFFHETYRIEKPALPWSTIPEKFYIFYYHIPKRENAFFLDHLHRLGII